LLGTVASISIAIYIEWLNDRAGSYLPRTDGPPFVKWRETPVTSEAKWRKVHGQHGELTEQQIAEMRSEIDQGQINNDLRFAVGSIGLLQYILALTLIVILVAVALRSGMSLRIRIAAVVCVAAEIACLTIAVHRGYWSSLGW